MDYGIHTVDVWMKAVAIQLWLQFADAVVNHEIQSGNKWIYHTFLEIVLVCFWFSVEFKFKPTEWWALASNRSLFLETNCVFRQRFVGNVEFYINQGLTLEDKELLFRQAVKLASHCNRCAWLKHWSSNKEMRTAIKYGIQLFLGWFSEWCNFFHGKRKSSDEIESRPMQNGPNWFFFAQIIQTHLPFSNPFSVSE